jgi:hypothetical protein
MWIDVFFKFVPVRIIGFKTGTGHACIFCRIDRTARLGHDFIKGIQQQKGFCPVIGKIISRERLSHQILLVLTGKSPALYLYIASELQIPRPVHCGGALRTDIVTALFCHTVGSIAQSRRGDRNTYQSIVACE